MAGRPLRLGTGELGEELLKEFENLKELEYIARRKRISVGLMLKMIQDFVRPFQSNSTVDVNTRPKLFAAIRSLLEHGI